MCSVFVQFNPTLQFVKNHNQTIGLLHAKKLNLGVGCSGHLPYSTTNVHRGPMAKGPHKISLPVMKLIQEKLNWRKNRNLMGNAWMQTIAHTVEIVCARDPQEIHFSHFFSFCLFFSFSLSLWCIHDCRE